MTAFAPNPGADSAHIALPPEEFYWALLEPPETIDPARPLIGLLSRRANLRRLSYQFEEHLPVPLEEVRLAIALHRGRTIACAIERARLTTLLTPSTRTLAPAALPPWLVESAFPGASDPLPDPRRWNVLIDDAEPRCVAAARARCILALASACCTILAVAALGVERRVAHFASSADAAHARAAAAYAQALGPAPSRQPASVRLAAELRALERRTGPASIGSDGPRPGQPLDATQHLAHLLGRVPPITLDVESLDIAPDRLALAALADSTDDAQALAHALTPTTPDFPWRLRQPHVTMEHTRTNMPQVRIAITLEPSAESPR